MRDQLSPFAKLCFEYRVFKTGGPQGYLGKCYVCRSSISVNAHSCPQCGEPDPCRGFIADYTTGCFLQVFLTLLALAGISFWLFSSSAAPAPKIESTSVTKTEPPKMDHYEVKLQNNCSAKIWVAVCYFHENKWVTEGWWNLGPGESRNTSVITTYRHVYFYAGGDENWVWSGSADRKEDVKLLISKNKFRFVDGSLPRPTFNERSEYFFMKDMGDTFREYTQSFTCDVK